jgi:polyisoprenoid-binding protein YceI
MKVRFLVVALGLSWSAASFAAAYKIDPAQSSVKWSGAKVVLGEHNGFVKIKEGTLDFDGKTEKGRFVIDMNSIECQDLKEKPDMKKKLEGHLKSDDFFSVSKHPEAVLVIKSLKPDAKDKSKYEASGDLTIKGATHPISFTAEVKEKTDKVIKLKSDIEIKRTLWGVNYNSPSGGVDLKTLGDKAIKDEVQFKVELVGQTK